MREWTREQIRKESSWEAFKQGEALLAAGKVPEWTQRQDLRIGLFVEGRRKLRTVVRLGAVLEVECGCAMNRASGGVCQHAVALLLASAGGGKSASPSVERPLDSRPQRSAPSRAAVVHFPPRWQRSLEAGTLSVRIEWLDEPPEEGDVALSQWWAEQGGGDSSQLLLSGESLGSFLKALRSHPRLRSPEGALDPGGLSPLHLSSTQLRPEGLELKWQADGRRWIALPGFFGWVKDHAWGAVDDESLDEVAAKRVGEFLQQGTVLIPRERLAEELQAWLDLTAEPRPGWLGELRLEARPPQIRVALEGSMNALDADISILPPETAAVVEGHWVVEEPGHQEAVLRALKACGFQAREKDRWVIRDPEQATAFLANDLEEWQAKWQVELGPKLSHVICSLHVIRPVVKPVAGQSLAVEISFQTGAGKAIPRAKVLDLMRSGRLSNRTASGAQVVVAREVYEDFEPLAAELGIHGPEGRVTLTPAQFLGLQSLHPAGPIAQLSERKFSAPESLNGVSLRDYQKDGVTWLADRLSGLGGALLADEMGLGKTLQTIGAMRLLKAQNPNWKALVVVPSSLLANWEDELNRFAPELRVVRLHGAERDRLRNVPADVILTSYATMVRDLAFHLQAGYALMVLDEAGALRNPASETSKTAAKIPASHRVALTGTPVENRLLDLWAIFRIVAPGYLGTKDDFLGRYDGGSAAPKRLAARIGPYFLRRTKSQVAKDLPGKSFAEVVLELSPKERGIYQEIAQAGLTQLDQIDDQGAARMHLLTVLLRLRQFCLSPQLLQPDWNSGIKWEWLKEFLEQRAEQGKKTLVFSQFSSFLRKLEKQWQSSMGRVWVLDGSSQNRGDMVKAFQHQAGAGVFLISLKAGGYGLNLTAADAVVHLDPWWNPAAEAQANDRAHRIGQTLPVTVYRLLIRDSVEERVRRLQDAKRSMIEGLNGGDSADGWSQLELAELLRA